MVDSSAVRGDCGHDCIGDVAVCFFEDVLDHSLMDKPRSRLGSLSWIAAKELELTWHYMRISVHVYIQICSEHYKLMRMIT